MTAGTAVPIAAVKLVDGARGGIVAVDGVAGVRDVELALVPCMLERAVQLGFHPPQPLHGHVGVVGAGTPALQGFGGDGVGLHAVGAQIPVASRSDGHLIEGVEMRQGFEIPLEGQTPLLEQFDVRLAVGQEFLLEIELHPTRHLVSVPTFEILAALDAHAVGQVGVLGWQGPHVVLVGPGVEEVGGIPFLQFGQAKGLGKGRQRHLKKGQGVDEANVPHLQLQDLGAISGLFQQSLLTVVFFHQGVAIIALKIVGQHRQGTSGLFCQVVQPHGELLEASLALETEGVLLHFGFGHHQVRDVLSILLSTFDVEEDVEGCWGGFILGWCHLHEAAMALNLHVLLAGRTGGIPTAVFLPLFSPPQQFKTPRTFLPALADGGASGSGRFAIVGLTQVVGQTGGAVEGAATGWAGHGGGLVVGIGFSVIRAPILQATATMGGIVGAGMLTGMIVGLVTKGAEIPFAKKARQAGQGIVMAVFVQDPQALGTATISETRVGPIGVHHHQRVVGQGPGELVQLIGATRSRTDPGSLVEFQG